jgi:rSAM/selenodomain-associated transferase 2
MAPLVSVVVPVLADRAAARQLIAQIPVDFRVEIIVAEAGAEPGLESLSHLRPDITVLHAQLGRGRQMNEAAGLACGEWLLFLHADSKLPPGWLDLFHSSHVRGVVGGWFRFALDDPAWQARAIERGVAMRVRLFRLPYGDQGIFVRRQTFATLGGYRHIELMEDVEFVRRLVNAGRVVEMPQALITSARRWRRDGWFRRSARNLTLLSLYFCGVPTKLLAKWYS